MTEAKMLGAKDVAAMLKVNVINFRRWLRANDLTADGGRYEWKKGSPDLERLLKQYKEYQENGPQREKPKSEGKKSSKKKGGKKTTAKKSAKPKATRAKAEESDFEESDETEEL